MLVMKACWENDSLSMHWRVLIYCSDYKHHFNTLSDTLHYVGSGHTSSIHMVGFCQHNRLPGNRTGYRRNDNNVNIGLPFEVEARPSIEALMSEYITTKYTVPFSVL